MITLGNGNQSKPAASQEKDTKKKTTKKEK